MTSQRVLFLCTGNSARSQMAEGLVDHYLRHNWIAHSAGTFPSGRVHPLAIAVMAELGIDITEQFPKSTDVFRHTSFDLVITVCDDAAENCPVWLGTGRKEHFSFPDPAQAAGTLEEERDIFRHVRDDIRQTILPFLQD